MNLEFGIVTRYFSNRGFGFVSRELSGPQQDQVFFHISVLEQKFPELASAIKSQGDDEATFFWYEVGSSTKGSQVVDAFDYDDITSLPRDDFYAIVKRLKSLWINLDFQLPEWMVQVAKNTLSSEQFNEICLERDTLERERRELEEKKRKEQEALRKIEEAKREKRRKIEEAERQKRIGERKIQEEIEKKEFELLVAEMKPLGITHSNQVSWYIVNNRLGYKYKNISGILTMEQNGTSWNFKGGFPPMIYARLCEELGLSNQGTRAKPVDFTPFKDL